MVQGSQQQQQQSVAAINQITRNVLKKIADNTKRGSWANRMRERRFRLFRELIAGMPRPLRIIDVGGTESFWEQMGFIGEMGSGGEVGTAQQADVARQVDAAKKADFEQQANAVPQEKTAQHMDAAKKTGSEQRANAAPQKATARQKNPAGEGNVEITLLNLQPQQIRNPGFVSVVGDARDLSRFNDQSFDVAFSNSVIEHVGGFDDQTRMAREMQRVGKRIFLQTPNRNFPLEPHFLFPFFQFLPLRCQVWLLMHFRLGWYSRFKNKETATEAAKSVRLLTRKELKELFPHATIRKEKIAGLTKSFVVMTRKEINRPL